MANIITNHTDSLFVFYFLQHRISKVETSTIFYKAILSQSFYDIFLVFCQLLLYNYLGTTHTIFLTNINFEAFKKLF